MSSELVEKILETLKDDWGEWHAEWYIEELITPLVEPLEQQLAQARALLEEALTIEPAGKYPWPDLFKLKIRAFLDASPKEDDVVQ